jgi:hypothetical protein
VGSAGPELHAGDWLTVTLTPGFSGATFPEYFRIYVDFDADGYFDGPGELAFDPGFVMTGPVSGLIGIPEDAAPGLVRLRVMMKFLGTSGLPPAPCETFGYGQVEDHCAQLLPPQVSQAAPAEPPLWSMAPNPAGARPVRISWRPEAGSPLGVRVWDLAGRPVFSRRLPAGGPDFFDLDASSWPGGVYQVEVWGPEGNFFGKLVRL